MPANPKKASRLSEIISALPTLSSKELAAVKAAIALLSKKDSASAEDKLLFDAISKNLEINMTWATFEAMTAYRDFKTQAPEVLKFIAEISPFSKKAQQMGLLRYVIGLLVRSLKARNIPITLGIVCRNLNIVPMIFDAAFPGYRQSGLVYMLLKQMEK